MWESMSDEEIYFSVNNTFTIRNWGMEKKSYEFLSTNDKRQQGEWDGIAQVIKIYDW